MSEPIYNSAGEVLYPGLAGATGPDTGEAGL